MKAKQKGFTLLEILVGLSISSMLSLGALGLILCELNGTAAIKNSISAADELASAESCIGKDVMMAESTNLVNDGASSSNLSLAWTERYEFSNIPHTCTYSVDNCTLIRNYDGFEFIVARNITYTGFSLNNNVLEVMLSCTPQTLESRTVDKTFSVYLRTLEAAAIQ
jgi:prepilin-type N-terminal cleavage/methylation domain-containing protein